MMTIKCTNGTLKRIDYYKCVPNLRSILISLNPGKRQNTRHKIVRPKVPASYVSEANENLHNPLMNLEKLGTRWFGVIIDFEGVISCPDYKHEQEVWQILAVEEKQKEPSAYDFKKAEGMKQSEVLSQIFCWTRDPDRIKLILKRKQDLLEKLHLERENRKEDGMTTKANLSSFFSLCETWRIPVAILSSRKNREELEEILRNITHDWTEEFTKYIVGCDEFSHGLPDTGSYILASQVISRPSSRCIVISNSILSIEAAKDLNMKSIIISGKYKPWELHEADLVVSNLEDLTFQGFQTLIAYEAGGERDIY
jgi:5-amino-6-(5-phospho-D-ribitylamino)uracil phosphatase